MLQQAALMTGGLGSPQAPSMYIFVGQVNHGDVILMSFCVSYRGEASSSLGSMRSLPLLGAGLRLAERTQAQQK